MAIESASHASLEVFVRPVSGIQGTIERELSTRIRKLMEQVLLLKLHPRSLVQVTIQSLESTRPCSEPRRVQRKSSVHGSVVAAMINAASCCLLDAACVPMCGVVCAIAVGRRRTNGTLEIDPDPMDEECECLGCFAFMYRQGDKGEIAWVDWHSYGDTDYVGALELARSGSGAVLAYMRERVAAKSAMSHV